MRFVLTAIIFVGGLFFIITGLGFFLTPGNQAAGFGMSAEGAQGLSTLRADMTAFFLLAGFGMVWGAWRRNGDLLTVSAALFGIAFIGRLVSLFADGMYDGWWQPMLVEFVAVVLNLWASRLLPHHDLDGQ